MEFRIWTELIQQSRGTLHPFLPLLDRGLDGVIHRLTDGAYLPIQVKCRTETFEGMVHIVVPGSRLVDDRALLIAGLLSDNGLGPMLLVVEEGKFKELAMRDAYRGDDVYSAWFSMHPKTSRWKPYLISRDQLAERLLGGVTPAGPSLSMPVESAVEPMHRHDQWLGFLGEAEVIRRLAENPRLDLFRPFPDLEMVEVLARDNVNGRFVGLQVKTAVPADRGEAHFHVRKATFIPTATTWMAGLAWIAGEGRFADECLLVPTEDLRNVAIDDGATWAMNFHPHSPERTPLDPYRRPLAEFGACVGAIMSGGSTGA